jgi:recombination protein RecA
MAKSLPEQIKDSAKSPPQKHTKPLDMEQLISTGSLLLDLAISGGVSKYGGIPGRTIVQVYGPNSTGKTTLMAEALGYVQRGGGKYRVRDPEARLKPSYCKTFGVHLDQEDIERTGTITDMFEGLIGPLEEAKGKTTRNKTKAWEPDPTKINIYAVDALAALASKMEMEQGDKMGQKRAKDFSEGFRMISDHIYTYNILMFCTDQVRDNVGGYGEAQKPGGGNAVGYYSSLRIKLKKVKDLVKEVKLEGMDKPDKITYGIEVEAFIKKSSIDRPFRTAPLRLLFNYGYDDIGANLQWLKAHGAMSEHPTDPTKKPGYVIGEKNFGSLDAAIKYVEDEGFEQDVRDWVVDIWGQIEAQATPERKEKVR